MPEVKAKLAAQEIYPVGTCGVEFGAVVLHVTGRRPESLRALQKADIEKRWPIIKAANIKGE